ncbi:MAG: GAF domain-containing protein [Microscillaceae bacterium]|jgi:hypothetical protein|nr:GAF domain-containing protein [Microscillaceae bacterium]
MKKNLNRYAIHSAIFLIVGLMIVSAVFSFYNRQVMLTNTVLKEQVEFIRQKTQSLHNQGIKSSDLTVRAFAISRSEKMLQIKLVNRITNANLDTLEGLLKAQKQNLAEFYQVKDTILNYLKFQDYMIDLIRKDSMAQFKKLFLLDRGDAVWAFYNKFATRLFEKEKILFTNAQANYEAAMNSNIWVQMLLLGLGIPTMLFIIYRLNQDSAARRKLLAELALSHRQYLFDSGKSYEELDRQVIIQGIMSDIKEASEFINRVADGNYQNTWHSLHAQNEALNQRNLVGALLKMQNQLQKAKNADEQRLWMNEGLNQLSTIIRNHQNSLPDLTRQALNFLVNYSHSQMGGLFLLANTDTEPALQLQAAYALDRTRLATKVFAVGEGLVGQVYTENKTKLIDQVPAHYTGINSGLGGSEPKNLILLPIKYGQYQEGVLEMGSLYAYEAHQIEFLERSMEYLGAALNSLKNMLRV